MSHTVTYPLRFLKSSYTHTQNVQSDWWWEEGGTSTYDKPRDDEWDFFCRPKKSNVKDEHKTHTHTYYMSI